jgi:integrase
MEAEFLPFVRVTKAAKPNTIRFYENSVANLNAYPKLADLRLDEIKPEHISGFLAHRQATKVKVSTANRDLATLRRVFNLAVEWGKVSAVLPRVRLLAGENHRERVLTSEEERKYLDAATTLGHSLSEAYQQALEGIRTVQRREQPERKDAFLLRDVATILLDCALRPEECFRLRWAENVRDGAIEIHTGKGSGSRRRVPMTSRVRGILEMRQSSVASEWVFPAKTRSGHMEESTLKKRHHAALGASGVAKFVLYTFRHTCLTRWAKHMDPYKLYVVAGHTDMKTTKRYVHPNDADILEAMEKAGQDGHKVAQGRHNSGHNDPEIDSGNSCESPVIN